MNGFAEWLKLELHHRRWSQAELARRTGYSKGLISDIINCKQPPSPTFCVAVAKTLGVPAAIVLHRAGLVPAPKDNQDELYRDICELVERLPSHKKEILLHMVRALVEN